MVSTSNVAVDTLRLVKVPVPAVTVENEAFALDMEVDVMPLNSEWVCPLEANPWSVVPSPSMSATLCPCPTRETALPPTVIEVAAIEVALKVAVPVTLMS